MRNTKQRLSIISILKKSKKPLSATYIHSKLNHQGDNMALTTVYRTLDTLYENNLINRYRLNDKEYSYELKTEKHTHYLVCKNCKKKINLPECPLHELEKSIHDSTGFLVTNHQLELEGYCKKCEK